MRIAILSGTFRDHADGVAHTLQQLSETLDCQAIDHLVLAPNGDDIVRRHLAFVKVASLPNPSYSAYRISLPTPKVVNQLDQFAPDLLHIATPDLLGSAGLRYAVARGLPVVATYHTHFPSYLSYYRMGWLEGALWRYLRWFYNRCAVVFAPTKEMVGLLASRGIAPTHHQGWQRLRVWGRGIDRQLFNVERRSLTLRERWGGNDLFYIVFAGRLVWYKEVGTVRQVYRRMGALQEDWSKKVRFIFVGDGPVGNELKATMPRAIFLGHRPRHEVGEVLASCDLLLFPSPTETYGQVVAEAMSCGIPPVVSTQGGPAELVSRAFSGFVIDHRDVDGMLAAIKHYVVDSRLYDQHRKHGVQFASQLAWPVVNDAVIKVYAELTAPRSASAPVRFEQAPPNQDKLLADSP